MQHGIYLNLHKNSGQRSFYSHILPILKKKRTSFAHFYNKELVCIDLHCLDALELKAFLSIWSNNTDLLKNISMFYLYNKVCICKFFHKFTNPAGCYL